MATWSEISAFLSDKLEVQDMAVVKYIYDEQHSSSTSKGASDSALRRSAPPPPVTPEETKYDAKNFPNANRLKAGW